MSYEELTPDDLAQLDDVQLGRVAESRIYDSAIMNRTRWADEYFRRVDEVHDECRKRRRGIYGRAWNRASQLWLALHPEGDA